MRDEDNSVLCAFESTCFLCCGSSANSCRGSCWVSAGYARLYMCLCERTLPGGCSISWLQVLQWDHFLPAPPLFVYPWTPAISWPQGRGNDMKQDEHPGQEGSDMWEEGVMTLKIRERTTDTVHGLPSWRLPPLLRIDNVVFCHITSKYLPIFLFRRRSRAISSFIKFIIHWLNPLVHHKQCQINQQRFIFIIIYVWLQMKATHESESCGWVSESDVFLVIKLAYLFKG